jgi:hypothetical protein
MGVMTSPLRGASGNVEFLLHARRSLDDGAGGPAIDVAEAVAEAVAAVDA